MAEDASSARGPSAAPDCEDGPSTHGPVVDGEVSGLRVIWQLPGSGASPRALLFLAHGACHGAEDFFGEPGFEGLPVERRIVAAALERGFLVVAASSSDRQTKFWQPEHDGPLVAEALREVASRAGVAADLPLCALGASNGGNFVAQLPEWAALRAVVCQIMSLREATCGTPSGPPIQFVHMEEDKRTAARVQANVQQLRAVGRVAEERVCGPKPISADFFAEHCGISEDLSAAMADALRSAGLTDGEGLLLDNPRISAWRQVLQPFAAQVGDSLVADRSPISEVLNVAAAHHEITAEGIEDSLAFLERAL